MIVLNTAHAMSTGLIRRQLSIRAWSWGFSEVAAADMA
jgi:hypothetical protein